MFFTQEEIEKMKERVQELNKEKERLEKFIRQYEESSQNKEPYENKQEWHPTDIPFKCCQHCSNNPKNNKFASGVCHCTLPSKEITEIRWQ